MADDSEERGQQPAPSPAEKSIAVVGVVLTLALLAYLRGRTNQIEGRPGWAWLVQRPDGSLPLLRPMSEVAGRMAVQVGASYLEKERGGKGLLLGGVPGTRRGHVVILGGGIVGTSAARIAIGMGAQVTVLDVQQERMAYLEDVFGAAIETLYANPRNIEAAARQARYRAFENALGEGETLALAHHRDDQAETFLLRALRGSGVDGLRAMPAWRRLGRGWLWRPLLGHPRDALLAYAQSASLEWVEDPANEAAAHDRNHLRQHVMPLLRQRWPHAGAMLARSATLAGDAARLLASGDDEALEDMAGADPRGIDVARLLRHPPERRARILRHWLARLGLPPLPGEGVAQIESTLLGPDGDAVPEFAWADAIVRRWRGQLHASRALPPLPRGYQAHWDGRAPLLLPTGGTLELAPVSNDPALPGAWPVTVRARQGGERIVLAGRTHSHALKNVLQQRGVPPWRRERMPLLCSSDGTVLAAGDVVVSAALERELAGAGVRLRWRCPDHG